MRKTTQLKLESLIRRLIREVGNVRATPTVKKGQTVKVWNVYRGKWQQFIAKSNSVKDTDPSRPEFYYFEGALASDPSSKLMIIWDGTDPDPSWVLDPTYQE